MIDQSLFTTASSLGSKTNERPAVTARSWSAAYGDRHRLQRITVFPFGVTPPSKVRLYWRCDHYVLQWWDPGVKRTLSDRIDGDLVTALTRIREIETRLEVRGSSQAGRRRLSFAELLDRFLRDLHQRADADEIDVRTVRRYDNALAYLRRFTEQSAIFARYPHPGRVDRDFVLQFLAFLKSRTVTRNGRIGGTRGPLRGFDYVLETVHAALAWAADPDRGALLDSGFRNPFRGQAQAMRTRAPDLCSAPPITVEMAADWLRHCDPYQRQLFAPLILCGLRAAELGWVLADDVEDTWLFVRCHPELDHLTKGRRDKKFPLGATLRSVIGPPVHSVLWLPRRDFVPPAELPPDTPGLVAEFQRRLAEVPQICAVNRRQIRDQLLREAGALDYDRIEGEFRQLATRLNWPRTATLKGFRHLFATALENSGCPESYRRYFLGHSPGRSAIVTYTHLDQLERHYRRLLDGEFLPIMKVLESSVGDEPCLGR